MSISYTPELTASMSVKNLDQSIAWYEKVLNFSLLFRADEIGYCELATRVPGVSIGLCQNEEVSAGGNATNVWGVSDIHEAKAHLDSHGVRQDGGIQEVPEMVKLLTFYDPDGNTMMFAELLAGQG
ncbi:VOC family protein [Luteimonas sp. FXH3W]|uniref:VOC family protein n=1 Tax=Aquilutibacter rugosus TaxID=3115820 RepID=A0ABU7UZ46_9GAMM